MALPPLSGAGWGAERGWLGMLSLGQEPRLSPSAGGDQTSIGRNLATLVSEWQTVLSPLALRTCLIAAPARLLAPITSWIGLWIFRTSGSMA